MALSDDQLLDTAITKFIEKISSYRDGTWDIFKTFLSGLTKTKIKTFLSNAFQAEADKIRTENAGREGKASELEAFKTDIDSI